VASVITTPEADADAAEILGALAATGGYVCAAKYDRLFDRLYDRLTDHPKSCQVRRRLGPDIRHGVIKPYSVFYRYDESEDTVIILRILHSKRRITRKLLLGDS
jgi:toxin ParE1/3/4